MNPIAIVTLVLIGALESQHIASIAKSCYCALPFTSKLYKAQELMKSGDYNPQTLHALTKQGTNDHFSFMLNLEKRYKDRVNKKTAPIIYNRFKAAHEQWIATLKQAVAKNIKPIIDEKQFKQYHQVNKFIETILTYVIPTHPY